MLWTIASTSRLNPPAPAPGVRLPPDLVRMLTLPGDGQVGEGFLGIETCDTLRAGLEIEPQRTLDRHLEKAERLAGKDPGDDALLFLFVDHDGRSLAVPVVALEPMWANQPVVVRYGVIPRVSRTIQQPRA